MASIVLNIQSVLALAKHSSLEPVESSQVIGRAETTPAPTLSAMSPTNEAAMDKVVVITGASAGIGAELAKQLGARGAKVVLAARRKPELDAVAKAIGDGALAVVTDVTKRGDVEHLAKAAIERFGRIDVWVNNAGRGISRSVADLVDNDLDAMWRDNMKSVVYGIQAVLPYFKSRNAGQIVNVSSGLSRAPLAPARAAYGAVKSAVNMLTASLRVELRATHPGIHVTLLLPGVVATEFGLNSLGVGIVDNRKLPGAQPVEGAAKAIVDVIENPRPEAYTSPFIADVIARYLHEPEAVEAEIAARPR
jgi:short-subunit dehydrogenase